MAVNRFDNAADVQYISQYTPIPFQELYNLGKAYNDRVDKTYDDLSNAIKQYRQFRSPSAIDTQRYYDLTLKGAEEIADEFAANPDLLKTVQGRQRIQNYINTRPYAELSSLEQSRDNLLKRQELEQKLSLAGKWNSDWHRFDYTNYSTKDDGIFNNLNLVPYKSVQELVRPYTDQVEDRLLYSDGMWDYYGKSKENLRAQVDAHKSEILNTPEARMHMRALINRGASPEQAAGMFLQQVYTAAEERNSLKREANPYAVKRTASGGNNTTPTGSITTRTDEILWDNKQRNAQLQNRAAIGNINANSLTDDLGNMVIMPIGNKAVIHARDAQRLDPNTALNIGSVFEGMKRAFAGIDANEMGSGFREADGSISDDVLSSAAKEIRRERGDTGKSATRVHSGSKLFEAVNKMYDYGVDALMSDNTAYSQSDLKLLFGDDADSRSLAGMNILTPKQYLLGSYPGLREFIESEGISTLPIQADAPAWAPLTTDRDYDIEEAIARDGQNAKPIKVNKVMIVNTPQGPQSVFKVTVKYPTDKLPTTPGWFNTVEKNAKKSGYTIDSDGNITTDLLVVTEYNDQMRRRMDMESEALAGSTDSKKQVRQTSSNDQIIIGKDHLIGGQY